MTKAVLIGVGSYRDELDESMFELENLAIANNIECSKIFIQGLNKPNNFSYVRKGKLEEIKEYFELNSDVKTLISNDELTASTIRNIKKILEPLEIKVLDRTMLILDIFSNRAKTREAIIQVEIAKLKHDLAHLVLNEEDYDQQRGSSGLANKGSGEKKIDLDRRVLKDKIQDLKVELGEIEKSRYQQKKQRVKNEKYLVALVGYTNAGKSTIMNNLIDEDATKKVFEKDMLFATLDTSVRKLYLDNNREVLLSDTVGFIDRLPHQLVESFKSTLEEAIDADLLLHVVDYSNSNYLNHIEITNATLKEIGINPSTKMLYLYNKADLKDNENYPVQIDNKLIISARDPHSIDLIKDSIQTTLYNNLIRVELLIPYSEYNNVDYLNKNTLIHETESVDNGTIFLVDLNQKEYEMFKRFLKK